MASTPIHFFAPKGLTLKLELYPLGSDTIANTAGGDTCTEASNAHGSYTAPVTEAITGIHRAVVVDGSDNLIGNFFVKIVADDTTTYYCDESLAAVKALPNAEPDAAGGLPISDAGGLDLDQIGSDTAAILVDTGTTLDGKIDTLDTVADAIKAVTDQFVFTVANQVDANAVAISGDGPAADNLESDYDGTGYNKSNSTIGTTTANTDMRGTDSAALASVCTEARLSELDAANLPADIDAILEDSGTTIPGLIAALNDLSASDVNAEVVDVLTVDTQSLPGQEAPPLSPTFVQMAAWLYKGMRNAKTQDASTWKLMADDGSTVDAKSTVSDAAGVTTFGRLKPGHECSRYPPGAVIRDHDAVGDALASVATV